MCREIKRKTPFAPKVLTTAEKLKMQQGVCTSYKVLTTGEQNRRGLASWTDQHKQAWELDRMENPEPSRYVLRPVKC